MWGTVHILKMEDWSWSMREEPSAWTQKVLTTRQLLLILNVTKRYALSTVITFECDHNIVRTVTVITFECDHSTVRTVNCYYFWMWQHCVHCQPLLLWMWPQHGTHCQLLLLWMWPQQDMHYIGTLLPLFLTTELWIIIILNEFCIEVMSVYI